MFQNKTKRWSECFEALKGVSDIQLLGSPFYDDPYIAHQVTFFSPFERRPNPVDSHPDQLVHPRCAITRIDSIDEIVFDDTGKNARVLYSWSQSLAPEFEKVSQNCEQIARSTVSTGQTWREFTLKDKKWEMKDSSIAVAKNDSRVGPDLALGYGEDVDVSGLATQEVLHAARKYRAWRKEALRKFGF